jgi:hypothetical protein
MPVVQVDWVLGLKAATPQYAPGLFTEATVWVPSASGTVPAATAAAEPLDSRLRQSPHINCRASVKSLAYCMDAPRTGLSIDTYDLFV